MERKDTERIIRLTRVTPIDDKARAGCRGIQREAWLITRLALTLMSYLGTSTRWMMMCARLIAFVIFLLPAFMRMMYWFIRSVQNGSVLRSIRYGRNARNLLDIYRPSSIMHQKGSSQRKVPVVVFVSGGAWTIGYKGWGGLMGRIIMQHGIMFVCVDYRNFPQGTMSCMLDDIDNAMSWIFANISEYGGDTNRIYLVGQSAGAQLTCMTLLNQVRRAYDINRYLAASPSPLSSSSSLSSNSDTSTDDNDDDMDSSNGGTDPNGVFPPVTPRYTPPAAAPSTPLSLSSISSTTVTSMMSHYRWRASDLRGYIGISGPYDLVTFIDQLEKRGINRRLFTSIVGGDEQLLALYSPSRILHDLRILTPSTPSNDVEDNIPRSLLGSTQALSPRSPSSSSSLLFEASSMAASFDPPTITTITSDNRNDKSLDNHRLFYALPEVVCLFPPMQLYHGSKDVSVPLSSSQFLYESLRQCGIPCTLTCYNGKSHTDPILEDPMSGNDPLLTDLITTINGQSTSTITSCHRLVNGWAISAARFVNPF